MATGIAYNYYKIYKDMTNRYLEKTPEESLESREDELKNPFDDIESQEERSNHLNESNTGEDEEQAQKPEPEPEREPEPVQEQTQTQEQVQEQTQKQDRKEEDSKKESYTEVVQSCKDRFEDLQIEQEDQLNQLIKEGKLEYSAAKENGKSIVKVSMKYFNAAKRLESKSDSEFKGLKNQLKAELKEKSYKTDIVKEIEKHYKKRKKELKGKLMKEVKGL